MSITKQKNAYPLETNFECRTTGLDTSRPQDLTPTKGDLLNTKIDTPRSTEGPRGVIRTSGSKSEGWDRCPVLGQKCTFRLTCGQESFGQKNLTSGRVVNHETKDEFGKKLEGTVEDGDGGRNL